MKERLLLLETHHLGDAVLSVPFVRGALQDHAVTVVCRASQRAVYEQIAEPGLAVETWEPPWMAEEGGAKDSMAKFRSIARTVRPDVAVSCWADLRVHWLLQLSGAARRVGFPMSPENLHAMHLPWRRKRLRLPGWADRIAATWLLTDALTRHPSHPRQIELWRQIAVRLGVPFVEQTPWLRGSSLPADLGSWIQRAREAGRPIWLLHAGARAPMRRWPVEHFQEIARRLREEMGAAVLTIDFASSSPADLRWQPASIAEFLGGARAVSSLLCNDSFPAHAAAAMGVPVWTIFTAQEPSRFAPFGNDARVISAAVCPIRPCYDRCLRPSYECLEAVTLEMVWRQITGKQ